MYVRRRMEDMNGRSSEEESIGSFSSLSEGSSDFDEDTAASSPSSPGHLYDLSTLKQLLLCKRGLSIFYQGKSQSYTCFSNIKCLEDLAKPEKQQPFKKLRTCKSFGNELSTTSRTITKKAKSLSRVSFSSSSSRRRNFFSCRNVKPPAHPHVT